MDKFIFGTPLLFNALPDQESSAWYECQWQRIQPRQFSNNLGVNSVAFNPSLRNEARFLRMETTTLNP